MRETARPIALRRLASPPAVMAALAAAALLLGFSAPVAAQQAAGQGTATALVGTVVSAEEGEPIEGVEVILVGSDAKTTTDEQGQFVFASVTPGPVRIRFRRAGTTSRVLEAELQEGSTTDLTARIPADPIEVGDLQVQVEGQRHTGLVAAAHRRTARAGGVLLGPEELASAGGSGLSNLLKQQSRVKTKRCRAGSGAGMGRRDRGSGSSLGVGPEDQEGAPGVEPTPEPGNPKMGRRHDGGGGPEGGYEGRYIPGCQRVVIGRDCEPRFYLDGSPLPKDDPAINRNLGDMNPAALAAVEIYRSPSQVPARFRTGDACAVILLWTQRGN